MLTFTASCSKMLCHNVSYLFDLNKCALIGKAAYTGNRNNIFLLNSYPLTLNRYTSTIASA